MYASVHLLQILNAKTCSPITLFFMCIKLNQILSLFFTINNKPCIFTGDYYPRKIFKFEWYFQKILICSVYMRFIEENKHNIWCNKKGLFWHYILKNIPPQIFWRFFFLSPLEHIFNKVNRRYNSKSRWSWDKELAWLMIIVKTSVWQYLGILLYILFSS